MDPTVLLDLIDRYGIPLVVIALLSAAVWVLARALYREMQSRIKRAEEVADRHAPALERLAEAQEVSNQITQTLLDELRRGR